MSADLESSCSSLNTFARRRKKLEEAEGEDLSDWDIATLLDCYQSHVRKLMTAPDEEVRPAYVLALEYAREVGLDECGKIYETRPEAFARLFREITLNGTEVARMLGIDPSTVLRYRDEDRDLDVPRQHYLALLYIHRLYGRGAEPEPCRRHIETYAES